MSRRRLLASVAVAAVAVGVLSGCGGAPTGGGLDRVSVGVLPGVEVAPMHLAAQAGVFARHGLEVQFDSMASSPRDVLEAVSDGRYDFAHADLVSVMDAAEDGLDVRVLSGSAATSGDRLGDFAALMVPQGSDIGSVEGLAGRTIGVEGIDSTSHVVVESVLRSKGVDTSSIEWREVSAVASTGALLDGTVDAALVTEPFATAARIDGMTPLAYPYAEFDRSLTVTAFVSSARVLDVSADVAGRFALAVEEALSFATEHQTQTRDHIAASVDAVSQVRTRVWLPVFSPAIDEDALVGLSEAAVRSGALSGHPDLAALFAGSVARG